MSYSEKNGQVVLRMSREDYELLLIALGSAVGLALQVKWQLGLPVLTPLLNRLNSGNPNYTPYQVEDRKP